MGKHLADSANLNCRKLFSVCEVHAKARDDAIDVNERVPAVVAPFVIKLDASGKVTGSLGFVLQEPGMPFIMCEEEQSVSIVDGAIKVEVPANTTSRALSGPSASCIATVSSFANAGSAAERIPIN